MVGVEDLRWGHPRTWRTQSGDTCCPIRDTSLRAAQSPLTQRVWKEVFLLEWQCSPTQQTHQSVWAGLRVAQSSEGDP